MPVQKTSARGGNRQQIGMLITTAGMLAIFMLSLSVGTMKTDLADVFCVLSNRFTLGHWPAEVDTRIGTVIWEIRLPRALVAIGVGAALATAGACLQGLFRNPLADPGLIGVSSGGAIGAIFGIITLPLASGIFGNWVSIFHLPILAMAGAMVTTFVVYRIARIAGRTHVTTLLLAGIAVNALAGAIVGGILYMSDNEALRRFTFWTLGSLHTSTWKTLSIMTPFIALPLAILPRMRGALNAFLLGEAEAYHLGFNTQIIKRIIIGLCALMVGVTVAFCGLIGFVGLVVPHVVRLIWGPDFRKLVPLSALMGSLLVLTADFFARTINSPAEIPIGVVTSLIGAPFFLYLIYRRKRQLDV